MGDRGSVMEGVGVVVGRRRRGSALNEMIEGSRKQSWAFQLEFRQASNHWPPPFLESEFNIVQHSPLACAEVS